MSIMKRSKKEDAVSPVIGVMLMLVVTIVIAAVVSTFATGIGADTKAASNAVIELSDYEMKTVYYSGNWSSGYQFSSMTEETEGSTGNYAVYGMTFMHKGGEQLDVSELRLAITYKHSTYTTPFNAITNQKSWSSGQKLSLILDEDNISDLTGGLLFGLGQQNMNAYEDTDPSTFDWAIIDGSGYTVSKGTATI